MLVVLEIVLVVETEVLVVLVVVVEVVLVLEDAVVTTFVVEVVSEFNFEEVAFDSDSNEAELVIIAAEFVCCIVVISVASWRKVSFYRYLSSNEKINIEVHIQLWKLIFNAQFCHVFR